MNERQRNSVVVALTSVALLVALWLFWSQQKSKGTGATAAVPVVMHTSGGRLEVATVNVTEAFKLVDPKTVLGIDLGTTVSHVRVSVEYRYYIEMAREWTIRIHGTTAVVEAGEVKPRLPVTFDSATIEKETKSGWARFNKKQNLDKLEWLLSNEMEERAKGYKSMALGSSRKTVTDFVTTWLMKEQHWKNSPEYRVEVVFPGETSSLNKAGNDKRPQP